MFTAIDVDRALTNAFKAAGEWFRRGVPERNPDAVIIFEYKMSRHGLGRLIGSEKHRLVIGTDDEGVFLVTSEQPETRFYPCCRPEVPEFLEAHLPKSMRVIDPSFPPRNQDTKEP